MLGLQAIPNDDLGHWMIEIRGLWSQHGSTGFILYQSTFTSHLDASSVAELFPVNGDQHR